MNGKSGMGVLSLMVLAGCGAPDLEAKAPVEQTGSEQEALVQQRGPDAAELARMQRYLDERYSPQDVVHRFRSAVGDDIDCVRLEAQPGLRRQGMVGHVLEKAPRSAPMGEPVDALAARGLNPGQGLTDGLDETGAVQHCPEGAIPVLRISLEHLKRFQRLEEFFRKVPGDADPLMRSTVIQPPAAGPTAQHQYAHAYQAVTNRGATSTLNLWNPYVELSSEFSLSQIWVTRGSGTNLETVETGIQLYRQLYGDSNSRLFIYYTPDGYTTGCYNLSCSAFVQTNSSIVVGGKFGSYSSSGGTQYEQKLEWFKDGTAGHWWLRVGTTWVGYYPRSLFDSNGLIDGASYVDFGGEIIDNRPSGRHTATDMGSGAYPSSGWQYAAFQRLVQYIDTNNVYQRAAVTATRDSSYCYDISLGLDTSTNGWGRYFYFGGPGYNTNCQ